jgi:magnesium chelatase family protein
MGSRASSTAVVGVDAVIVEAEAEVTLGLRRFTLVGLPDGVVKEAKERVRCAIQSSGFEFPSGEVIVALAPAWLPKVGSGFDLAIAIAILAATGLVPRGRLESTVFLGELSLDGGIRGVRGAIQAAIAACRLSRREGREIELVVSSDNAPEAACIDGVRVAAVSTLLEAISYLRGELECQPASAPLEEFGVSSKLTLVDVIGQHGAKRVLQIGAAGGHNLLLIGPPGAGKSMLAARYPSLLPPLSIADSIEVTKIAAVAESDELAIGRDKDGGSGRRWGLVRKRPFRAPHHSASVAGIIGGGPLALPGEVTLAHRGVLFLDELSEFRREVLESLRQPLEAKKVVISRARLRMTYPADFLLIAAMNPCPCGRRGTPDGGCQCSAQALRAFYRRLSGPIIDRIDLQVWVPPVQPGELLAGRLDDRATELTEGVAAARQVQAIRFGQDGRLNSSMSSAELKRWCRLDENGKKRIEKAAKKRLLSARAISRIIKTARTIADLAGAENISADHVGEALNYRLQDIGAADTVADAKV